MKPLLRLLQERFTQAIARAYGQLSGEQADLAPCGQEGFGHYQCNSALRLAKIVQRPPREVAQAITRALDEQTVALCAQIDIAGPGFINITLSSETLSNEAQAQL